MTDDERLTALEERMTRLEAHLQSAPAVDRADDVTESDPLWALEGLRARVDDPGAVLLVGHVRSPDGRVSQWQEAAETASLLEEDWGPAADAFAALGHGVRLRLLQRVFDGACSVSDLTAVEGVGTSGQVYHHLRLLVAAGWLRAVGAGRYEVPVARVVPLLTLLLGARR